MSARHCVNFQQDGTIYDAEGGQWFYDVCEAARASVSFAYKASACGTCATKCSYLRLPGQCPTSSTTLLLRKLLSAYWLSFWLLFALLVLHGGHVYAEWIELPIRHDGTATYVHPETILRNGNVVKMWEFHDLEIPNTTADGVQYLSLKGQSEYDCAEELVRAIEYTAFSDNMLSGSEVDSFSSDNNKWRPVAPGSISHALWKFACGKS